jgi:ribosomal protein S18 acetylase RimI-like enzyme
MVAIRRATPADADVMAALRWEFRGDRERVVESESDFVARCADWMRHELAAAIRWRAWVAELDGAVAGQLWLQIIEKLPNPNGEGQRHAYVSNLYVRPAARGGTGARLLEAALADARAERVDRVVLWPSTLSVSLYQRHGFTRDGGVMELTL